jgi:hypothetical protein
MKTTSSKLFRGVMLIATLLVPVTTWWASLRYYNSHRQVEETLAAQKEAESQQQVARLREIQEKYAGIMKENDRLREAIKDKGKGNAFLKSAGEDSAEFVLETKKRSTWNWPTDPDHVWQNQRRRASELLIRLDSAAQDLPRNPPSTRRSQTR